MATHLHHDQDYDAHARHDAPQHAGMEHHQPNHGDTHRGHDTHHGPDTHAGHGGHAGHAEVFRRRFWISLIFTIPVVAYSHMVMELFDWSPPSFWGSDEIPLVLGSAIFWWAGWPFLSGGVHEIRRRQPGMMLLVAMAISVAYAASLATEVGWVDIDLWFEVATLIVIMLLGHWQEMKALGQARGALDALAELLPDDAERITDNGVETVSLHQLRLGDVVLVRPGGRVPPTGPSWTARRSWTKRW